MIDWEPPIAFGERKLPTFPVKETLPDWLQRFVTASARALQIPTDMVAMLCISTLAAACGGRFWVGIKNGYMEPLNLFVVVALPPGNRKSAAFRLATAPIIDWERRKAEQAQDTGESAPHLLADDITPAKLGSLLVEQAGKVAVMSAEGGMFERISAHNGLDILLKAHAGDHIRVDRMTRSEFIDNPALTITLTVQPDVLCELIGKTSFRKRGLGARFFYSMPQSLIGHREIDPPAVPLSFLMEYEQRIQQLLDVCGEPKVLKYSPYALFNFHTFCEKLEPSLGEYGDRRSIQDWAGKLSGSVARISGLLHLAHHGPAGVNEPVDGEAVVRAAYIAEYLTQHARAVFSEFGGDTAIEDAKKVIQWISHHGVIYFTARACYQNLKGSNRFKTMERLRSALSMLENHKYIREILTPDRGERGRKPSPSYETNPHLLSKGKRNFSDNSGDGFGEDWILSSTEKLVN